MFGNPLFAEKINVALTTASFPSSPEKLYNPVRYILSLSGKRIRPQLVLLGANLFGIDNMDDTMPASIAIEYFHNFSLIHDDIMDKAPLRRGKSTVHQKWNENVAILSGDALLVKAYEELAKCPVQTIPSLLKTFNKIALEVCEGQQMDMDFEERDNVSDSEYIEMIRLKTSVLLGGALAMGAIIAEASTADILKIYDFGVNLGIAFQLQDDILDAYGDPETFGKQVGGDIIVNKKTILYILLRESLKESDEHEFQSILDIEESDSLSKVERMKGLYNKYETKYKADQLKENYTKKAFENLDNIAVSKDRKSDLYALANTLMNRKK